MAYSDATMPRVIDDEKVSSVGQKTKESKVGFSKVLGAAFLIAGTSIGAGMLGLPVKTAAAGLGPTCLAYIAVWVVMLSTAMMTLEASLYFKGETNMISMASRTMGPWAGKLMKVTYLLFFYSVMASYTTQGVSLTSIAVDSEMSATTFSTLFSMLCFVVPFALIVFMGAYWVDQINRGFIFGLVICFSLLVLTVVNGKSLVDIESGNALSAIPALGLIVTSLGFHGIIPSLKTYLHGNVKKIRAAIIIGSLIPLVVYMLWQFVILSHIPIWGKTGLVELANSSGNPGEKLISAISGRSGYASIVVIIFSLCAIFSSYVGVALGITDFLFDALKVAKKKINQHITVVILTFLPPVIFALVYPSGFMLALSYAGVFAALLLVMFPAAMVLFGRNHNDHSRYKVIAGKPLAVFAMIFGLFVVTLEVASQLGILGTI